MKVLRFFSTSVALAILLASPSFAEEGRPWLCRDKPVFSLDRSMEYVATARPGRQWRIFFMQYSPDVAEDVGEGIADHLPAGASEFLERRQIAVFGTVDDRGNVWASVVTGDPGFIETVDDHTLRVATHLTSSDPLFHNLATEGHVALFAPDFVSSRRV